MHHNEYRLYVDTSKLIFRKYSQMEIKIYLRLTNDDTKCFLCISIQNKDIPINILGAWIQVGEANCLHEANPGDRIIVLLKSEFLCWNSNSSENKFQYIDIPENNQSVAKTVECSMLKTAVFSNSVIGKITFKKHFSNSYPQIISEVTLDMQKFSDSLSQKDNLWTVRSLYDLASLYGYLKSPFKWHYLADLLGLTSKEIEEIDRSLLLDEYFISDSNEAQMSSVTPRRIFCLLLSNFQKLGGSLSQVANILHSDTQRKKQIAKKPPQQSERLRILESSPNILNCQKRDRQKDENPFSIPGQIYPFHDNAKGTCYSNQQKTDLSPFQNSHHDDVEIHNTPEDYLCTNKMGRNMSQPKRRICRNGSLDRMMNCQQSWMRHTRRRNSLPETRKPDDSNHDFSTLTFNLSKDLDNFIEFGTPIKRASSCLNSDKESSECIPNKRQRLGDNNACQPVGENTRRPKIMTKRRADKSVRQRKGNQTLLPNLWQPPATFPNKTTEQILNVVHAKIEESRRETEAIQRNVKSFLEKLQSPVQKMPNFVESKHDLSENNSMFLFSDKTLEDDNIWNIVHLCNSSIGPNWKTWLKICFPTYSESNLSDSTFSKILSFSEVDDRLTSYLILSNWVETNSNPDADTKPTLLNLFQRLTSSGYSEFVELCKKKLFRIFPHKRSCIH
uniref:Uncharacterized protein n=1 Tax=Trichobilharzia regenti TaxID=157069 RepID=A0AA85JDS0_TRIRE|nr:unnamed protein product [Trichobilharzia regenti]